MARSASFRARLTTTRLPAGAADATGDGASEAGNRRAVRWARTARREMWRQTPPDECYRFLAPALAGLEHERRARECGECEQSTERLRLEKLHVAIPANHPRGLEVSIPLSPGRLRSSYAEGYGPSVPVPSPRSSELPIGNTLDSTGPDGLMSGSRGWSGAARRDPRGGRRGTARR